MTDVFSYISGEDPWEKGLPLEIQVLARSNQQTVVLRGELDLASADLLEAKLLEVCTTAKNRLVLDLREVTFIGSSGLRAIIAAGRLCEQNGREFALIPGPQEVQRLFELTGLSENLSFAEAEEPAAE
ncbi:MAG: anti-sigma-factor antagonist [Solirubrobacterales bacterium]|nr:anti-sigma-factor antagonist [Solirubrobacterales bacterium]